MALKRFSFSGNNIWIRVISISVVFLTVGLSDALLSFWIPAFMQEKLSSAFLMGIVMSFSSVVGIVADFVLPQLIQGSTVRKLILIAIVVSILFSVVMFASTLFPVILLFLLGMALWGVYYEFLGFARQQFVADAIPHNLHASAAALVIIFMSLAYTVGPLVSKVLTQGGDRMVILSAIFLSIVGFLLSQIFLPQKHHHTAIKIKKVNLWNEFRYWKVLLGVVWPIIVLSVTMGIIDSAFWTTGTVLSEKLSEVSVLGNFFVPAYMFPSLFMGLILIRLNIYKHKKKLSQFFFLLSGASLMVVGFATSIPIILGAVFVSSIFFAIAHPLLDAVYADINERMGRGAEEHLIGLSSSAWSGAYIIGPVLAGFISQFFGEQKTFALFGLFSVAVSVFLLITTKRKLVLPQSEISKWN